VATGQFVPFDIGFADFLNTSVLFVFSGESLNIALA
jgi:hypothetical protein